MVMQKTTVYLPDTLKLALERAAAASGRSEAELIREGIALVTQEQATPKPRLPLFASGEPDLAQHIDEALAGFGER
jgi:Ribbon-helix-helix protein, copG family